MQIVTYSCDPRDETPKGFTHVAHIIALQPQVNAPDVLGFHPVVFRGNSHNDVRAKAETWWQNELDKAQAKRDRYAAQSARQTKSAGV